MNNTATKTNAISKQQPHLLRIFSIALDLADTIEHYLESKGEYAEEFVKGIKQSQKETKKKKALSITSISSLR